MGSTSKPAQDGKVFLGYGKHHAIAPSGEVLSYFMYMRWFFALPCSSDDR